MTAGPNVNFSKKSKICGLKINFLYTGGGGHCICKRILIDSLRSKCYLEYLYFLDKSH